MRRFNITGRLTRLEPNGFGVVRLDEGKDAFFDRFAVRASQHPEMLKPGCRVIGETDRLDTDVVRLESVGVAPRR